VRTCLYDKEQNRILSRNVALPGGGRAKEFTRLEQGDVKRVCKPRVATSWVRRNVARFVQARLVQQQRNKTLFAGRCLSHGKRTLRISLLFVRNNLTSANKYAKVIK
jgi:hypothetical protein